MGSLQRNFSWSKRICPILATPRISATPHWWRVLCNTPATLPFCSTIVCFSQVHGGGRQLSDEPQHQENVLKLSLQQWNRLRGLVHVINSRYSALAEYISCSYSHRGLAQHTNCRECTPFVTNSGDILMYVFA